MKSPFARKLIAATGVVGFALCCTSAAVAADAFPSRPIRIIVTSAAGGFVDVTTRYISRYMSEKLGQPVIVENRTGAGGIVAIRAVKAAPPDGYTLLASVNTVTIQQSVTENPGYDVATDFAGVGPINRAAFLLVTSTSQPDKTLGDMLARAKANPAKLTYASAGMGSTTHLGTALFGQRAGVQITHVPYKGNSAAWPDVIAGRVGMIIEPWGTAAPMIRDGRMKVLGVTSTKRLDVLPDVPTIAEQGVPYNFYLWAGLLAPKGTPKEAIDKLSAALQGALTVPAVKDRFREEGSEVMSMTPDEFTTFLKGEAADMAKLVAQIGLQKE
jgi:tripartite-type tricarboxylate transporter receptor subunit TctC